MKPLKHLLKAGLKIKLSKCSFFKEQIHFLSHLVSGMSILPQIDKIESPLQILKKLHFLGLTGYYCKFICSCTGIAYPQNHLTYKAQPFVWTPECQVTFDMLHSRLANTPIVQLPDPNKPYLLFTDASKFCYSGMLTQASTIDSNEALMKILTSEVSLTSVESETQDL